MYALRYITESLSMPTIALVLAGISTSASAQAPTLWWEHIEPKSISQSECLKRAESLLEKNKAGRAKKVENTVVARNQTTNTVVECLPSNSDTEIVVIVTSNKFEPGNKLFRALVKALEK